MTAGVDAGREAIVFVDLEVAVDLVDEQVRPGLGDDVDDGIERRPVRQHAGRVVRGVDDDELGPWRHLAPEGPDVDCPAGILAELVEGDLGSAAAGHLVEALVAGPGHDRVVARPEDGVDQGEDPLLGAGQDEDVVGRGGVVERGDLVAQERVAGRLRVAEAEVAPERGGLIVGEGEELAHRPALDVAGTEDMPDCELPAGEVPLQLELGDAH